MGTAGTAGGSSGGQAPTRAVARRGSTPVQLRRARPARRRRPRRQRPPTGAGRWTGPPADPSPRPRRRSAGAGMPGAGPLRGVVATGSPAGPGRHRTVRPVRMDRRVVGRSRMSLRTVSRDGRRPADGAVAAHDPTDPRDAGPVEPSGRTSDRRSAPARPARARVYGSSRRTTERAIRAQEDPRDVPATGPVAQRIRGGDPHQRMGQGGVDPRSGVEEARPDRGEDLVRDVGLGAARPAQARGQVPDPDLDLAAGDLGRLERVERARRDRAVRRRGPGSPPSRRGRNSGTSPCRTRSCATDRWCQGRSIPGRPSWACRPAGGRASARPAGERRRRRRRRGSRAPGRRRRCT